MIVRPYRFTRERCRRGRRERVPSSDETTGAVEAACDRRDAGRHVIARGRRV